MHRLCDRKIQTGHQLERLHRLRSRIVLKHSGGVRLYELPGRDVFRHSWAVGLYELPGRTELDARGERLYTALCARNVLERRCVCELSGGHVLGRDGREQRERVSHLRGGRVLCRRRERVCFMRGQPVLVRRRVELRRVAKSVVLGMSREQVVHGWRVCDVCGRHGVRRRERGV